MNTDWQDVSKPLKMARKIWAQLEQLLGKPHALGVRTQLPTQCLSV